MTNKSTQEILYSFLRMYIACDVSCKQIVEQYKEAKKKPQKLIGIKMCIQEIIAACHYVGLPVTDELLYRLFSSRDKRGACSAKHLRDMLVHTASQNDIREITERFKDLETDMNEYIRAL